MLGSGQRKSPAILPVLLILGCGSLPIDVLAQSDRSLVYMIFDPVLLESDGTTVEADQPAFVVDGSGSGILPGQGNSLITGQAQPSADGITVSPEDLPAEIDRYLGDITEMERMDGNVNPQLVEKLLSLGRLYQQQNNHERALEVFGRADYISHINKGLFAPEQIPIVEGSIESYMATGQIIQALEKQRYLLYLNKRNAGYGDVTTVASRVNLADRNMEKFSRTMAGPFEAVVGENVDLDSVTLNPSKMSEILREYAIDNLYLAKNTYFNVINVLLENQAFFSPQMIEVEHKYLETLFLLGYSNELVREPHYYLSLARKIANLPNRWTFLRRNDDGYETGIKAFERILTYLEYNPSSTSEEKIKTMIELGDWHLLFGMPEAALTTYGNAYAWAEELGLDDAAVGTLFRPDIPVHLPMITAKPNRREKFEISKNADLDYAGYIDVAFSISRYGTAVGVDFLGQSSGTTYGVIKQLKRYLRNSPFRPRLYNGEQFSDETFRLRYYYAYLDRQ